MHIVLSNRYVKLTQHALSGPGVVIPGAHSVLDMLGNPVGVHVVDAAVHGRPEIRLARSRCSDDVSHLRNDNQKAERLGNGGKRFQCDYVSGIDA